MRRLPPDFQVGFSYTIRAYICRLCDTTISHNNGSENRSGQLTACFSRFREGNDSPHRMDYMGGYPAILYTLRPEGIRCYFAYDIICAVEISIGVPLVRCAIQPTFDTLTSTRYILPHHLDDAHTVKETSLTLRSLPDTASWRAIPPAEKQSYLPQETVASPESF